MKRFIALAMSVVLLLSLSACAPAKETDTTTTTTSSTTTTTTVPVKTGYNVLTGKVELDAADPTRPVGFMVPNDSKTIGHQPQIDKADFYMECETEGAIPRLLVAFGSISRVPETFGPIRSARSPFVATARSLGLVYVHAGGSYPADAILDTGVLDHVNALVESSSLFWRDETLRNRIDYVHSLVTSQTKLKARIEQKNISLNRVKDAPFSFGEKAGDIKAETFQLNTTPSHVVTFVYDENTGLYGKNIGKMATCKPHNSLEGNQIQVSNVLVLYAEKYMETDEHCNFREGSGTAYLMSGGTARKINFNRTADSLTFTELDGSAAKFAEGKIYMVLASDALESKLIFAE